MAKTLTYRQAQKKLMAAGLKGSGTKASVLRRANALSKKRTGGKKKTTTKKKKTSSRKKTSRKSSKKSSVRPGSSKRARDKARRQGRKPCSRRTTKEYRTRPGPPYAANECKPGSLAYGNNGHMYVARRASNGVIRWQKA